MMITIEKKVTVSMPLPRSKNGTLVPVPCNSTSIPVSCFFVQKKITKTWINLWRPVFCILTSTPGLHHRCEFWQTKTNVTNSSWRVPHIHTSTKEVCLKIMSYPNSQLCTRVGHALFFHNFIWSTTAWPSLQHTRTKDFEKWKKGF